MAGIDFKFTMATKVFGFIPVSEEFTLSGGPFMQVADRDFPICLREEASGQEKLRAKLWLPIKDFSIPVGEYVTEQAVKAAFEALFEGKTVSAGCAGGTGRTGLFFALMLKTAGYGSPITSVRSLYKPHAVETTPQENYVHDFEVGSLRKQLHWPLVKYVVLKKLGLV